MLLYVSFMILSYISLSMTRDLFLVSVIRDSFYKLNLMYFENCRTEPQRLNTNKETTKNYVGPIVSNGFFVKNLFTP